MVLVSGAGGKTGQAVVAALLRQGVAVRAWLRQKPNTEYRTLNTEYEPFLGDMLNPADWQRATSGIRKIYHICPNMQPREVEIGRFAIEAAQQANLAHFVYHSVLHPQTEEMPHHWNKLRVEELLLASGVPFTILQPTAYMQNLQVQWATMQQTGQLTLPYPPETRISLVDLQDVAEAAATVLTSERFVGATLELVGTAALSQNEVAARLSRVAGREITAVFQPLVEWEVSAQALPTYARKTLLAMFRYYAANGLVGSSAVLQMMLGRKPTSLEECVRSW